MLPTTGASRATIECLIRTLANAEGLPHDILIKMCDHLSHFNAAYYDAVQGTVGLFQLPIKVARSYNVDPYRWHQNVYGAILYLRILYSKYHGNLAHTIAAYYFGPSQLDSLLTNSSLPWHTCVDASTRALLEAALGPNWRENA